MRSLSLVLVVAAATAVPSVAAVGAAQAKPAPPRAELVTKAVTGSLSNGKVTVESTVKNKGTKKAGPSQTAFYLSTDATRSSRDAALGTVKTGRIKPKRSKPAAGVFALPSPLAAGSYRILACADSGTKLKERNETNNCKASKVTIAVTVTAAATASPGGTIAVSAMTGGTCAGTVCTFTGPGAVTFTPTPDPGHRFGYWTGDSCTGQEPGPGNTITFISPTKTKACTGVFVPTT
jgi:hypothetical protein